MDCCEFKVSLDNSEFQANLGYRVKTHQKTNKKMKGIISNNMLGYRIKPTVQTYGLTSHIYCIYFELHYMCGAYQRIKALWEASEESLRNLMD